ncbi:MAG: PQQ-binding-like beta-propeller repeat protein [Candidatus Heimdallarchaeota archaeon]|nr:PQQ-binding-like beta-propeller repeat protein [Candidatus Heimdallarchaeota archaeon]
MEGCNMKKNLLAFVSIIVVILSVISIPLLANKQELVPQAMGVTTNWTYQIGPWGADHRQSPNVADLDGDGNLEVLMGSVGSDILFCLNHDGTQKWNFSNFGTPMFYTAVADLEGDGQFEIVLASFTNFITCLNSSGGFLWSANAGGASYSLSSWAPTIADLDGDGHMEIIVCSNDGNPPYGGKVFCFNSTGAKIWEFATDTDIFSSVAVGDLDLDGKLEVVTVSFGTGNLYCLDEKGAKQWNNTLEYPYGYIQSSPAIGDLDGDGTLEIIVASVLNNIYCVSNLGVLKWNRTTPGSFSSPALGDLDGNGKLEIVVGDNSGGVMCLNYNGTIRWQDPLVPGSNVESSPALADLDNDGTLEIIVGAADNYTYCLRDHQDPLQRKVWSIKTGYIVFSSPCVADLNNDGILEILISSFDCILYCLGLTGVTSSGTAPWYCYQGSLFHTGQMDSDGDWLDDVTENFYSTQSSVWDSDADGFSDGQEVFAGTDPNNASSYPSWPTTTSPVTTPPPTTTSPPPTTTSPSPTTNTSAPPSTTTSPPTTSSSLFPTGFISALSIMLTMGALAVIAAVVLGISHRRKK